MELEEYFFSSVPQLENMPWRGKKKFGGGQMYIWWGKNILIQTTSRGQDCR